MLWRLRSRRCAWRGLCSRRSGKRDAELKDQALRAAKSVALNVAEGGRRVGRDRTHHFTIASRSAEELAAALRIAEALGYLDGRETRAALELVDREQAMLTRLRGR